MGSVGEDTVSELTLPTNILESQKSPSNAPTNKLFSLENRTVVVTGGGRGLGITLAGAVLEAGGNVACIDILSEPSATEWAGLQKLAKQSKLRISYHKCDITDEESISKELDSIAEAGFKNNAPLHGTIACAGIQQKVPAVEYPVDGFRKIMEVNITGTFLTIKHSARIFIKQKTSGSIIMIASMSGQVANRVRMRELVTRVPC